MLTDETQTGLWLTKGGFMSHKLWPQARPISWRLYGKGRGCPRPRMSILHMAGGAGGAGAKGGYHPPNALARFENSTPQKKGGKYLCPTPPQKARAEVAPGPATHARSREGGYCARLRASDKEGATGSPDGPLKPSLTGSIPVVSTNQSLFHDQDRKEDQCRVATHAEA